MFLDSAIKFLSGIAEEIGLPTHVIYAAPGKPILLATWTGQKPELGAILLNSHTDVVPVELVSVLFVVIFSGYLCKVCLLKIKAARAIK